MIAFFHSLKMVIIVETTQTALASTFGVADDESYPLRKFSLEVWRDTPECLNTSSLAAPSFREAGERWTQSTTREEDEDEVRNESEGNIEFPTVLLASLVAPMVRFASFFSAGAEKRTMGKQ